MFEKEPFGALERLVTQKLLDVVKRVTKEELDDENWLRLVARLTGRSYEQMRVIVLEFLETDIFNVSAENCVTFLDPLIESWDIDLADVRDGDRPEPPPRARTPEEIRVRRTGTRPPVDEEPGLQAFLQDPIAEGRCDA